MEYNREQLFMVRKLFRMSILAAILAIAAMGCKKDEPNKPPNPADNMQSLTLQGVVNDIYGNPLAGVKVITGTATATTDGNGEFTLSQAKVVNKRVVIKLEKDGFFSLTRSREKDNALFIDAVLYPKGNSDISLHTTFDAKEDVTLNIGGVKIDISGSTLLNPDGTVYTGTAIADVLYLSPDNKNFAGMMPGGDLAAKCEGGYDVMLISYGMTLTEIVTTEGGTLQLDPIKGADITYTVPGTINVSLPSIPLWRYDQEIGIWVENGDAIWQGGVYVGTITYLEWSNLDWPTSRSYVTITVVDSIGQGVSNVRVKVGPPSLTLIGWLEQQGTFPVDILITIPGPEEAGPIIQLPPTQATYCTNIEGTVEVKVPANNGEDSNPDNGCGPQPSSLTAYEIWIEYKNCFQRYVYILAQAPDAGEVLDLPKFVLCNEEKLPIPDIEEKEMPTTISFMMGCTDPDDPDCYHWDESPAHKVTLSYFFMAKYPATQQLWASVMGTTLPNGKEYDPEYADYPIEGVCWIDIVGTETVDGVEQKSMTIGTQTYYENGFIYKLNKATGLKYRLPTEAEWEYAARGGQTNSPKYSGSNNIDEVAWYLDNADYKSHPVGTKKPNALGIYDMSGNVWEWCYDWYSYEYYTEEPQYNPTGPETGSQRVVRGGSWFDGAQYCRVSRRMSSTPTAAVTNGLGFRLVRVP